MSASPPTTAAPSQKRPLEEPSSPSGPGDQPDAKRPALDKIVNEEDTQDAKAEAISEPLNPPEPQPVASSGTPTAKGENGAHDGYGDTVVPDAPAGAAPSANAVLDTQPIQSTQGVNGNANAQSQHSYHHQDETGWLHMRAIISSAEAATVIGKGGENVTLIRRMSGAKCTVSDYTRGAVERILTVSGLVDAVAKV